MPQDKKKVGGLSAQYLGAESPEGRIFGGLRLKLSAQRLDKRQLGGHAGQRAVVTASVQTVLVVPHPSTPTLGEVFFLESSSGNFSEVNSHLGPQGRLDEIKNFELVNKMLW